MACNFASVNRGKRSITLNRKSDPAKAVLARLVERADIVLQSFLPETARKLGVDYESIKAINPDAIHCSISGYGEKGPLANRPGYDLMMQAFSGEIGRAHVRTPVTNAHLVCRLLLEKKTISQIDEFTN